VFALLANALEDDQGKGVGVPFQNLGVVVGRGDPLAVADAPDARVAERVAAAVELLLASIRDGKALPQTTYTEPEYITLQNFGEYQARLCS